MVHHVQALGPKLAPYAAFITPQLSPYARSDGGGWALPTAALAEVLTRLGGMAKLLRLPAVPRELTHDAVDAWLREAQVVLAPSRVDFSTP